MESGVRGPDLRFSGVHKVIACVENHLWPADRGALDRGPDSLPVRSAARFDSECSCIDMCVPAYPSNKVQLRVVSDLISK